MASAGTMCDVIVIGAGLWGSAAARHLAEAGQRVLLIGPGEPAQKDSHHGAFASHYDEARITRRLATDPDWSRWSAASIARYGALEAGSGASIFSPVGAVMAGPDTGPGAEFIQSVRRTGQEAGIPFDTLRGAALARRFPFFRFAPGTLALHERTAAGWINPRAHVAAEITLARAAGAVLHRAEVTALDEVRGEVRATCSDGTRVRADRALVACGAFSNCAGLLPRPLPLRTYARTVAFFELDGAEAARLAAMPSLIFMIPGSDRDGYVLPPVRYPDGRTYIKIGGDPRDRQLHTAEEMGAWFRSGGDPEAGAFMADQLRTLMPDLRPRSVSFGACATTFTETGKPLIAAQTDRIIALTGGNGAGAKCADEIGRLGAEIALAQATCADAVEPR